MLKRCALVVLLAAGVVPGEADAAALASFGTSVGLFAAIMSVLVLQAAPLASDAPGMFVGGLLLAALGTWLALARRQPPARAAIANAGWVDAESEHAELLAAARRQFVLLQHAWDRADLGAMRALTTAGMLDELRAALRERGASPNRTDVVELHAELLALEHLAGLDVASVEFSGLIRESADAGAVPFRELWMLARAREDGQAWRLARQQALL